MLILIKILKSSEQSEVIIFSLSYKVSFLDFCYEKFP